MARQVQLRRGTTAEHSTFTGAVGEVTVDTDKDVVVVHDGATVGGFPLMKPADLIAGTGISISGTTITNAAPDQTVVLTQGANVTITGTYPNFTIASTDTNTTYTAGTGLTLAGTEFSINSSVVTLTGTQTLTNKTLTAPILGGDTSFGGAIVETVSALSGTTPTLDPSNGTVQTHTLSGATTYTDGLNTGESMILVLIAGANTVTWPTMTWTKVGGGGAAPTLSATGISAVVLWKVGSTLYGSHLGDA